MDIFRLLSVVQDLRERLEAYHVTAPTLVTLGALALVLLAFSTREVLGWYLRTNQLRDEIRFLRADVQVLTERLGPLDADSVANGEDSAPGDPKIFRLDQRRNSR